MRKLRVCMLPSVRVFLSILLLATAAAVALPQGTPDFSGLWKQDNDRCRPQRHGDITLRIQHRGADLTVETSTSNHSAAPRHALQKYTTDGRVSVSTGADGDEFRTSVVWKDSSLVFSIEEHEGGRVLQSKETWSVMENGATLERIREHPDGEKQTLIYRQVSASGSESETGFQKVSDT